MASYFRKLLPKPTELESTIAKLNDQIDRIDRKQPEKANGRHEYLRDLSVLATATVARDLKSTAKRRVFQKIMKKHGSMYAGKSNVEKNRLGIRAKARVDVRSAVLLEQKQELLSKVFEAQLKLATQMVDRPPLTLAGAQWNDTSVARCEELVASNFIGHEEVLRRRHAACRAPSVMPDSFYQEMDAQAISATPDVRLPDWARTVIGLRSHFDNTAFRISSGENVEVTAE
jgi:hypothetical protein